MATVQRKKSSVATPLHLLTYSMYAPNTVTLSRKQFRLEPIKEILIYMYSMKTESSVLVISNRVN